MGSHPLPPMDPWLWTRTLGETYAAGLDPLGIGQAQRDARLARLLASAFTASPYYRSRWPHGRDEAVPLAALEPVHKPELMQHFDDWATDRRIDRRGIDDFLADPERLADAYLGRYLVWTSSGTSGEPGIFIQDEQALAAYDALDALRLQGLGHGTLAPAVWGMGQRFAFVAATGGHFAGTASIERLRRIGRSMLPSWPWLGPTVQTFSVQQPFAELAEALQRFAPTVLISYPSCADALAQSQLSGHLRLGLREVWVGGEQLSVAQRQRIRTAFGARLRNSYGSSECYAMAWECAEGRLHLNHDWLILEPVDRQLRPVMPGEASHSVLLTNLANHTQPLLRYELGDSVRFLPEPCRCGSGFPAIEVQGRADHTLVLRNADGAEVRLLPLALSTVIEEGAGITQFQLLCTGPQRLELRFEPAVRDPRIAFRKIHAVLGDYLAIQGLAHVCIVHGHAPPQHGRRSGKLERVCNALSAR